MKLVYLLSILLTVSFPENVSRTMEPSATTGINEKLIAQKNAAEEATKFFRGDVDGDRQVTLEDFGMLKERFGVDYAIDDFAILKQNFGKTLSEGVAYRWDGPLNYQYNQSPFRFLAIEGNVAKIFMLEADVEPGFVGVYDSNSHTATFDIGPNPSGQTQWIFQFGTPVSFGDGFNLLSYENRITSGDVDNNIYSEKLIYGHEGLIIAFEGHNFGNQADSFRRFDYYNYQEIAGYWVPGASSEFQRYVGNFSGGFSNMQQATHYYGYEIVNGVLAQDRTLSTGIAIEDNPVDYFSDYRNVSDAATGADLRYHYEGGINLSNQIDSVDDAPVVIQNALYSSENYGSGTLEYRRNSQGQLIPRVYRPKQPSDHQYIIVGQPDFLSGETDDFYVKRSLPNVNGYFIRFGEVQDNQGPLHQTSVFGLIFTNQLTGEMTVADFPTVRTVTLAGVVYNIVIENEIVKLVPAA